MIVILGKKFFPLKTVEELGEGPGGPGHPLFFDQNEARIAEKNFVGDVFVFKFNANLE